MKLQIFSIFDEKAQAYFPPFFLPTEAMAVRTFTDCCNDKQHKFGEHPEDYTMFNIGEFDIETSEITNNPTGTYPIKGLHLVKNQPMGKGNGQQISDETSILSSPESGDPTIQL